jgi:hypothetical protein
MGSIEWIMLDEQEAIRRLKRGDIGGLEVLVSRYQVKAGGEADESLFAELAVRAESIEAQLESSEFQNPL